MRNNLFKGMVFGAVAVTAALLTACLGESSTGATKDATLTMSMGLKDVRKDGGLAKGQTIKLSKLVVTLTSNAATPDTVRDTLTPGQSGFDSIATTTQLVTKNYNIKPLRDWKISVKSLDRNDSVIHADSAVALAVKIGETRSVTLNLASKFVMYIANFKLPDSLRASGTNQAQKLYVYRLMMVVDGDTVAVRTQNYFSAGSPGHTVSYDYIKAGVPHDVALFVFADSLSGWDSTKPVFGDTVTIAPNADTTIIPNLPWTGPGSIHDPAYDPNNPGGAKTALTINISKVNTVVIDPVMNDTLFKRN